MKDYSLEVTQLIRDGEQIAEYDRESGKLDFLPDCAKYRVPGVRFIRSLGHPVGATKLAAEDVKSKISAEQIAAARKLLQDAGQLPSDFGGAPVNSTTGQPSVLDYLQAGQPLPPGRSIDVVVDPIKTKTYAGAPPFEDGSGDKTPAFVDWLYENHPSDADLRYLNRKTHRV